MKQTNRDEEQNKMCTFGLFHSWLTTDMEQTNHMGAGSSMLLNAVFSRSSLTSTALSLTALPLCVCCLVLVCVCVGVYVMQRFVLSAALPLSQHLSSVLICWGALCVWECAFVCLRFGLLVLFFLSLSRCRCSIGLSFTTRFILCLLFCNTRTCVCVYVLYILLLLLSHGVCVHYKWAVIRRRTTAWFRMAIFYHAFDTEHTLSFMECDRFGWTGRTNKGENEMDSVRSIAKHIQTKNTATSRNSIKNRKEQMELIHFEL